MSAHRRASGAAVADSSFLTLNPAGRRLGGGVLNGAPLVDGAVGGKARVSPSGPLCRAGGINRVTGILCPPEPGGCTRSPTVVAHAGTARRPSTAQDAKFCQYREIDEPTR